MNTLQIFLNTVPETAYTKSHLPLKVTFQNTGKGEAIRILRQFEPLPVFFTFSMVDKDGRHVAIPGAGKVDLPHHAIEYVVLSAGESFTIEIELAKHIANRKQIKAGPYTLSVNYHNQYGEHCFQGEISSQPLTLVIR